MASLAILGAGMSGLAAACIARDQGHDVTLFEKSRGVGGRAATRRRDGFLYDHGAQYIKQGQAQSVAWITKRFLTPDLIDIQKPIWIFDQHGVIQEGDPQQNAEPKWCYRSGINTLAKQMAQGLNIRLETRIASIQWQRDGWQLVTVSGESVGSYEYLIVTLPSPQASELVSNSQLPDTLGQSIRSHLEQAEYQTLLSIMLGYRPQPRLRPYYALVNTDKAHPISWLAWEHEKAPERVPANAGLLIAQMAPQYSREHWQADEESLFHDIARQVSTLLEEELSSPIFTDLQRWRYALPSQKADAQSLQRLTHPHRLAFCGDGFTGGRVHLALENGITVAQQLLGHSI